MRYYFAGAYARRAELYRKSLTLVSLVIDAQIVSRWLWLNQAVADTGFSVGELVGDRVAAAWEYGERDVEDLAGADAIVSFTGEGARGGRHIEHGIAMAYLDNHAYLARAHRPFRLIVVGPREHVFHCHPATEVYPDFEAFLKHEIGAAS